MRDIQNAQEQRMTYEISGMRLVRRAENQRHREMLARENFDPSAVVARNKEVLALLGRTPFSLIGQKLTKGERLSFGEAFIGMSYVVSATNRGIFQHLQPSFQNSHELLNLKQEELVAPGQTFLTAMAQREAYGKLTSEEIAGMVASAMMDSTYKIGVEPYVTETAGMGGDRGFTINGERHKVINASTLSAIVLSSLGIPVMKHGSYANTSEVGSTDAISRLGVNVFQSSFEEIQEIFEATNFYFSDAHISKTIHDLSHSPFVFYETINHVIGPMTPPIDAKTKLHKVIGVNEGVHPETIGRAYELLHKKGYQNVGNVVIVSGLDKDFPEGKDREDYESIKPYMMLDEVSPYQTLLGIVQSGKYIGSFIVTPADFGTSLDPESVIVANTKEALVEANRQALRDPGSPFVQYLAMNAAIGLLCAEYLDREDAIGHDGLNKAYLKESFDRCKEAIVSGKAARQLQEIVKVSKRGEVEEQKSTIFEDVDVLIFDLDNTLIRPRVESFYGKYSEAVNRAVARRYNISVDEGKRIADHYRRTLGGGEKALFEGTAHTYFPELVELGPDYVTLYEEMCAIDPKGHFDKHPYVREAVQQLRAKGKKVVALTDSARGLSEKVLAECGFDPKNDFDLYLAYEPEHGPHKMIRQEEVFRTISRYFDTAPERIISVGDSYKSDIAPAQRIGMKTCLVGIRNVEGYHGLQAKTVYDVFAGEVYEAA